MASRIPPQRRWRNGLDTIKAAARCVIHISIAMVSSALWHETRGARCHRFCKHRSVQVEMHNYNKIQQLWIHQHHEC